jgi:hypothetical protein
VFWAGFAILILPLVLFTAFGFEFLGFGFAAASRTVRFALLGSEFNKGH